MSKYIGSTCICCGKRFAEGDDIVVCPDCGTPYHRECYKEKGSCVNTVLHDKGVEWMPDAPVPEVKTFSPEPGVKRCIRCGAENPPEERYCQQCGTPLINMDAPRPFNNENGVSGMGMRENAGQQIPGTQFNPIMLNQDSDIDGVKLGDYARYVGSNPIGFLPSFIGFAKAGRVISMNIFAFLFTPVYFMYRKMIGWGIAAMAVMSILGVPSMIEMLQSGETGYKIDLGVDVKSQGFLTMYQAVLFLSLGVKIASGLFANYLYYKQAKRDIGKIRMASDGKSDDEINKDIILSGGISWGYALLGMLVYTIMQIVAVIAIARFI